MCLERQYLVGGRDHVSAVDGAFDGAVRLCAHHLDGHTTCVRTELSCRPGHIVSIVHAWVIKKSGDRWKAKARECTEVSVDGNIAGFGHENEINLIPYL